MEERLAGRSTAATSRDVRFAQLVSPWIPEMYRLAAAICGISDADDVTQDALVDAWRGFDRLREETSIRPWLHAIVANRARKDLRFRRFRPRTVEMVPEKLSAAERDPSLSVAERDRLDSQRKTSPLACPPGAIAIDSTHLTLAEVVERMAAAIGTCPAGQ